MFVRDNIEYRAISLPDRMDLSDTEMLVQATTFYDQMKCRHTVRDFTDLPISRAVTEECARTAGTVPSGANHQP